jgi:EAL domain-containing protein (putative c-di-GMP-specific phosphodiesterase class I)
LSNIKHYSFDEAKIDRSFVKNLTTSLNATLIVENVYSLAEQTMLGVVAEGIEDEKTLTCIKRLECTIVQGFYYFKPIPLAKLTTFIAAWPTAKQDA